MESEIISIEQIKEIIKKEIDNRLNELNGLSISKREFCRRAKISFWKLQNLILSGAIVPDEKDRIPVKFLNVLN